MNHKLDTTDIAHVKFTSAACPTDEDITLWESLNPAEQLAWLQQEEDKAFRSGVAENASKEELLAEVLAEQKNED